MKTTSERKHADWFPSSNIPKCLLNVQSGAWCFRAKASWRSVSVGSHVQLRGRIRVSRLCGSLSTAIIHPPAVQEGKHHQSRSRTRALVEPTSLGRGNAPRTVGGLFPRRVPARACVDHLRDFKGFHFPLLAWRYTLEVSLQKQQQHGSNKVARLENKRADRVDVRSRTFGTPKDNLRQLGTSVQM